MSRLFVPALILSAGLGVPAPVSAQLPANYVRLDLHATRDGQVDSDLVAADIEIREDNIVQQLESFQRIGPESGHQRLVVFLDSLHVQFDDATRKGVAALLDRLAGGDDLVALMAPETEVSGLTFGEKAVAMSALLASGDAGSIFAVPSAVTAKEAAYASCYPAESRANTNLGVATEMSARRRERQTLDALETLVRHLRTASDGRTSILLVSTGWRLFGDNTAPASAGQSSNDSLDVFRGRRRGTPAPAGIPRAECERDRAALAAENHTRRVHELGELANRATAAVYPVHPDALGFAAKLPTPSRSSRDSRPGDDDGAARRDSLRQLGADTGAFALLAASDNGAIKRIADDLRSYYLVGYRSTNARLDGRFREVTIKALKPGVELRTRRGYRGLTASEVLGETGRASDANGAGREGTESSLRVRTPAWRFPDFDGAALVWIVGELEYEARRSAAWTKGARVAVTVVAGDGREVASSVSPIPLGEGSFVFRLMKPEEFAPGEYAVRVALEPESGSAAPLVEVLRLVVAGRPMLLGDAVLWRRGPSTGPRYLVTADPRFQRNERLRVEVATTVDGVATAQMLDRLGTPLQVPVQVTSRLDESGQFRWLVAEAPLAPLAQGNYSIEVTVAGATGVVDFQVVP